MILTTSEKSRYCERIIARQSDRFIDRVSYRRDGQDKWSKSAAIPRRVTSLFIREIGQFDGSRRSHHFRHSHLRRIATIQTPGDIGAHSLFFWPSLIFFRLRGIVSEFWGHIFNMRQPPAFEVVDNYCQHYFILMDRVEKLSEPTFEFPDICHPGTAIIGCKKVTAPYLAI
jgi:hypothetical protein